MARYLTRRSLLTAATVALPSACALRAARPSRALAEARGVPDALAGVPERAANFPYAVMSGDATDASAMLWTLYRYTGEGTLAVQVHDPRGVRVVDRAVTVAPEGFAHADVTGLLPGTRYRFAFVVRAPDGRAIARSALGRFRTAIAPDALERVTFGGTSCTRQFAAPFPAMRQAARGGELDFFIHAGDHTYCDGARTLDEYRLTYATNWMSEGLTALHGATSMYATWDDHEVDNNWDPETLDPRQIAAARRAFFEHHAIRRDASAPERIWRSFRWGRTLELFVLDCRGERRPSTRRTPEAQYLSPEQLAWLERGLLGSNAVFKFVVNSVPITDFPGLWDTAAPDRWEGYAAQRQRVLDLVTRRGIQGVWWLSGDFHVGVVARVAPDGPYAQMREVLMGPGGNLANPLGATLHGPQWEFVTGADNYTRFACDPVARTLDVSFVDGRGRVLFARRYPA